MDIGNSTAAATAPTGSATTLLFDSFVALMGTTLDTNRDVRYECAIAHDQAGAIDLYQSANGTTWDKFATKAVAAPSGGLTASGPHDFAIEGIKYLQVKWVNGGTNQGTWILSQHMTEKQRAAQT